MVGMHAFLCGYVVLTQNVCNFVCYRTDDASSQDEKDENDEKRRNYGGVYVGLPADASMYSSKEAQVAASSQSYAQNTQPGSSLPENIC
ncbi:overexpressed in colon carcinoma 1 protein isoform X1 [Rana temporaria]|uniref:overexpressed in colon carcinoma 1 protein isoform X1 n=1 Tax=Rana temporaria TaxID=8407 RepID=UPI001AACA3C9|nr:overexpressed in colon carcinoma 1 protein isoform X1 [Rana temporaria]